MTNLPDTAVIHVTSWLSRAGGGIPPVIWALARETKRTGSNVTVLGLKDEWTAADCLTGGVSFAAVPVVGPRSAGFSPGLKAALETVASSNAIIHCHGLWMYPGLAARKCAAKAGRPLIISPHGMLEPWALNNARWKKKLAGLLFENQNLARAQCLHALCPAEAANFRRFGLRNPIAIIPNGIDLDEMMPPSESFVIEQFPAITGRRHLLFLSRIHPKKGLENLLHAWRKVGADFKDWQLLIAGSGEPPYENQVKAGASDLIQNRSLVFLGPLYGKQKNEAFALAEVFVLPSFSEGFSLAILEAAAAALPVLLTPECNFPELTRTGAGFEVTADAQGIEAGLRQLLSLKDEQRKEMGRRGRDLVRKSYTWPVIAGQMRRVYEWLAGEGSLPETVQGA